MAAAVGSEPADRLLRRARRDPEAASARAERLAARTLEVLPAKFADVTTLPALGFHSIGDSSTGYEHYINIGYIGDDHFLDPNYPESLVYRVDGTSARSCRRCTSPRRLRSTTRSWSATAAPLMQWHVHLNLCWALNDQGVPTVVAVTDDHGGTCPAGSVNAGGDNPMVHVWVVPHECGPFAALEGHGAGQADAAAGQRTDQCAAGHDHGDQAATGAAAATGAVRPDASRSISAASTASPRGSRRSPRTSSRRTWSACPSGPIRPSPRPPGSDRSATAAPATSTTSSGTGSTTTSGSTRTHPESLVYEPQPDGSKKLVSAMYMLPDDDDAWTRCPTTAAS